MWAALGFLKNPVVLRAIGAALLVAFIAALVVTAYVQRKEIGELEKQRAQLQGEVKALRADAAAKERAAVERQDDATAVDKMTEELTDAIKDIPPGTAPGPAATALGCARLRRAGVNLAGVPACR